MPASAGNDLVEAQAALREATIYLEAVIATVNASAVFSEWLKMQPLIGALSPTGIRQEVMRRKLAVVNESLAALCEKAKMKPMEITGDMNVIFHGNAYELLSESGRWRVDLLLAILLGKKEGASLMLVDRLDMLHAEARPGVLMLLHSLRLNAMICMTAKNPTSAPDLEHFKIGRNYWIEDGKIVRKGA